MWGIDGMLVLLAIAFSLSTNRRAINPPTVIVALLIQIAFAFAALYWDLGRRALRLLTDGVQAIINSSNAGIEFLFGPVLPGQESGPVFAFQVLPIIIFFASLTSVLYHLKVLQWVVTILGGAPDGQDHDARDTRTRVAYPHPRGRDGPAGGEPAALRVRHRRGGERRRRRPQARPEAVGAMLIAFVSLIGLVNLLLGPVGGLFGFDELSLQLILG